MNEKHLYRVKEVYALTGLSRKLLFEYKELVPPAATEYAGDYKLYDSRGLEKLKLIAALRSIGFEKPDILAWFEEPQDEIRQVRLLQQVKARLQTQKMKIEDQLQQLDKVLDAAQNGAPEALREMLLQALDRSAGTVL